MKIKTIGLALVGFCSVASFVDAGSSFSNHNACTWAPSDKVDGPYICNHLTQQEAYGKGGSIKGGGPCGNKVDVQSFPPQAVGTCGQNKMDGKPSAE